MAKAKSTFDIALARKVVIEMLERAEVFFSKTPTNIELYSAYCHVRGMNPIHDDMIATHNLVQVAKREMTRKIKENPVKFQLKALKHETQLRPVTKQRLEELLPPWLKKRARDEMPDVRSAEFLKSEAWLTLRYEVIKRGNGKCSICGRGRADGAVLQVDHIKPRSKFPELALAISNLQLACLECNQGKSNTDFTDWRGSDPKDTL